MTHDEFARVLETHKHTVYRLAFSYLKNVQDAEDITQEAFLKLYVCGIGFLAPENEKAWLITVTANLCKSKLRANKLRKLLPFHEDTAETAVFMHSDLETFDLLSALKPEHRAVLYLYYYEGYLTREIAEILGKNENTVRTLLARGREQYKGLLEEPEREPKGGVIYGS